jgi:hypothetical protein
VLGLCFDPDKGGIKVLRNVGARLHGLTSQKTVYTNENAGYIKGEVFLELSDYFFQKMGSDPLS